MTFMDGLRWKCIHYHEELDTDNSILCIETTMEAKYRNGYLIKEIFHDHSVDKRTFSITFVPGK